jgi:type IV pilus assembly protein PilC
VPKFKYVATDPTGVRVSGVMSAASAVRVRNELSSREFRNVQVRERKRISQIEITTKKLKPVDLMNFSRQFAAFLRAGIPILDALHALAEEASNPQLKDVLIDISDALRSGDTLSNAMAVHSEIFPSYYIGILRSAELTGNLDSVLTQLAAYIERDLAARRAVKSALTYPAVIMVMAAVTVLVLVAYVLPKFETFFSDFDARLPLATRMLLSTSRFIEDTWVFLVLGAIAIALVLYLYLRSASGKMWRDRTLLRLPAIGLVVRYAVIERFFRILGSMLRAGVPVPDALRSATEATNNLAYQRALTQARAEVLRGAGLSQPISATGLFPGAAGQMLRVGEESGTLDQQLELAADYYQGELDFRLKRLTALFEPAVIVIMGLIVGFVAIALVSAMYGIFNQVNIK